MKLSPVNKQNPESLISKAARDIPPSGIREFFDIVYSRPDCISLGVGEPDFITPWRVCDAGIYAIKDGCTHYTSNRGLQELRELLSTKLKDETGIEYSPDEELLITMGVSQGLDLALRSIVNPGDEVIIFEPCYVSYTANIELQYGKPVIIPTLFSEEFNVDIDKLKKAVTSKTKAILLNYPSNPTGSTIGKETLKKIAKIAIENNLIVLSDEIYSSIVYDKEHFSIVSIPGMKERTIYLNGFSKSVAMTGWRLGYIAGPEYLVDAILKIHQYTALCAPSISQYAALEAMEKASRDILKMKREYMRRRNFIVNRFNEIGYTCLMPKGAFYVFPDISSSGLSSKDFALSLIENQDVAVVPGSAFGDCGEKYIRCSYATSMENIKEALKRIESFSKEIK